MSGGRPAKRDFVSSGNTECKEEHLRRTHWLFTRYMLSKLAKNIDAVQTSELVRGLIPLKFGWGIRRPPSFLEQSLLPKLCRPCEEDAPHSTAINNNYSASSQMTIFYGGAVHVYDDVSCDQFQYIMRVAGLTSSSPLVEDLLKKKESDTSLADSAPITTKKNPAAPDLPLLARRHSIRQFLEKRRLRLAKQSSYAAAAAAATLEDWHEKKQDKVQMISDIESSDGTVKETAGHVGFYPTPFPSTFGFCFSKEH